MRSIGNDIKSTNVDSSSSITQTHIDEAGSASDIRAAALVATQATYELGLRVTAKAEADAAQTIEINNKTTAAITTAHSEIVADGYFDKIITTDTTISNNGWGAGFAGFANKTMATKTDYALMQNSGGDTYINAKAGKKSILDIIMMKP